MITADQLIIHLIGDYLTQSDWMASEKTKRWFPAFCHALVYSLGFVVLRPSVTAWLVIFGTHYLIDRYRLARYVVWAKNWMGARRWWWHVDSGSKVEWEVTDEQECHLNCVGEVRSWHAPTPPFSQCVATGYPPTSPAWLAVWLMIIADNIIHIAINGVALRYL